MHVENVAGEVAILHGFSGFASLLFGVRPSLSTAFSNLIHVPPHRLLSYISVPGFHQYYSIDDLKWDLKD